MGDVRSSSSTSSRDSLVAVDPYALVQAILGARSESGLSTGTDRTATEYDQLRDFDSNVTPFEDDGGDDNNNQGRLPKPDEQPKNVRVGAANPYALCEAILGRRMDRNSVNSAMVISQVLQTDYDELFDMRNQSVLFAGLRLDEKERRAEQLTEKDMRVLRERDLVTPDLSRVRNLGDLQQVGIKDLNQVRVKHARITNGKIRIVIDANSNGNRVARQVSNREVTRSILDLCTPFRIRRENDEPDNGDPRNRNEWTPPNSSWRDMYDYFFQSVVFQSEYRRMIDEMAMFSIGDDMRRRRMRRDNKNLNVFDDPEQGCCTNSWLIAAMFSVMWADPASINRSTRIHPHNDRDNNRNGGGGGGDNNRGGEQHRLRVRFHDKGGNNNSRTQVVEVNYEIPVTNSSNEPVYCRASDRTDIWPSLYEKAFAKWLLGGNSDRPDITCTHSGDPVKCMAQLNGREPVYWRCENHDANDLLAVVRHNCVNNRTINPMCAWTHATGNQYRGANLCANHAYSICGYAVVGDRQYIVMRNPWGVTEPEGLTSYAGILHRMDCELWQPAEMMDQGGLFAMETRAFRDAFQYMGCAR